MEVLWLTAWAIIQYTIETRGLRHAQQDQLETEIRPYLRIGLSPKHNEVFQVKNIGRGIATAVHIENFMIVKDKPETATAFEAIAAIGPGESLGIGCSAPHRDSLSVKEEISGSVQEETCPNLMVTFHDQAYWIYRARFRPRADYRESFSILGRQTRLKRISKHED